MDSFCYWCTAFNIDGSRFDLGVTLGREGHGFDPGSGFFDAIRQDPTLSTRKLISEPWNIGPDGYQVGNHPPGFAEWNDKPDPALRGKVLAPFLGAAYGEELQAGKIRLAYRADEGRFVIEYYSNVFPVCPVNYPAVMQEAPELAQRFSGLTTQPADQPRVVDARTALATIAQTEGGQAAIEAILAAHAPDTPAVCWSASTSGWHGGALPPTK